MKKFIKYFNDNQGYFMGGFRQGHGKIINYDLTVEEGIFEKGERIK